MRCSLVQARPELGDVPANVKHVVHTLHEEDANLVVFPELFLSGYAVRDRVRDLALDAEGPEVGRIVDACRGTDTWCIAGFPRRGEARGVVMNSALLAGPDGVAGVYDKPYLPTFSVFEEDVHFGEGQGAPVFETPWGRVGLSICYDLFFPEVTKAQALRGADVLVNISASPTTSRTYFQSVLPARAIETTCFVLYTNNVGTLDNVTFWGGASVHGPRGDLKAQGPLHEEAVTRVTLEPEEVEEARFKRPVVRDTRGSMVEDLREAWWS